MRNHSRAIILLTSMALFAGACMGKPTVDPNEIIRQSVVQTVAAFPVPTEMPIPTAYPTPTSTDLNGLFCEYQFCIGHPPGMAYYDHLAALNPATPSAYDNGFLVAYQIPALVINVIWVRAPGTADPEFLLNTILDAQSDTRTGNLEVKLVRGMNVEFTTITTTISGNVPNGGAAAWTCGDRVFAWKAYTADAAQPATLFDEALARFTCAPAS